MTEYIRVTLVVDPLFGRQAIPKAEQGPLWVIDSPANTSVIKEIWAAGEKKFQDSPTFLTGYEKHSPEEAAVICIGTVHDHHPLWREFEIVGVRATSGIIDALSECADGMCQATDEGLVFIRKD